MANSAGVREYSASPNRCDIAPTKPGKKLTNLDNFVCLGRILIL